MKSNNDDVIMKFNRLQMTSVTQNFIENPWTRSPCTCTHQVVRYYIEPFIALVPLGRDLVLSTVWQQGIHKRHSIEGLQVIHALSHSHELDGHPKLIHD